LAFGVEACHTPYTSPDVGRSAKDSSLEMWPGNPERMASRRSVADIVFNRGVFTDVHDVFTDVRNIAAAGRLALCCAHSSIRNEASDGNEV
jgi:hypothetical protein